MNGTNKGFTLLEVIIVVAIIAVLAALALPSFTSQLEKSREAADAANIRSMYAEVLAEAIETGEDVNSEGNIKIDLVQTRDCWQTLSISENFQNIFDEIIGGVEKEPASLGTACVQYIDGKIILSYGESSSEEPAHTLTSVERASGYTTSFNKNITEAKADYCWLNHSGWPSSFSLGKAIVSGASGNEIKNAFSAIGDEDSASRSYGVINATAATKEAYSTLGKTLAEEAGTSAKYKSTSGYKIMYQTTDSVDVMAGNSEYNVTEYLVAECKSLDGKTTEYKVLGVRETIIYTKKDGNLDTTKTITSFDAAEWTAVPAA